MTTVRYLDRKLLRNIIRHTETHNRLQEENKMWRSRSQEEFGWNNGRRRGSRERRRGTRRGRQMDRFKDQDLADVQEQLSWNANRGIYRAELANQERWGHNGFMELYPEELINKESMDEMSDHDQETRKTNKTNKKAKRKRKHDRDHPSSKKRKNRETSSSSSDSDSTTSKHRPKKHRSMAEAKPSRHHRKATSVEGGDERTHNASKSKDTTHRTKNGGSSDKGAPSGGHEKSSHRDAKNGRSKKGRKKTSKHEKKVDKINGHRMDDKDRMDDRDWPTEEIYFLAEKLNDGDSNINKRDHDSQIGCSERSQSEMRKKPKKTNQLTKSDGYTRLSKHRDGRSSCERSERRHGLASENDHHCHKHKSSKKERKGSRENDRTDKWDRWR